MSTTEMPSQPYSSWSDDPEVLIRQYPSKEEWGEYYPGPLTLTRTGVMLFGTHPALGAAIAAEPVSDSDEWVAKIWSLSSPVSEDRDSCLLALNVLVATELPHHVEVLSPQLCHRMEQGGSFKYVFGNGQAEEDGSDVLNVLLWMLETERVRQLTTHIATDPGSGMKLYRMGGLGNVEGCDGEWHGYRMRIGSEAGEAWMYIYDGMPGLSDVLWSSYLTFNDAQARYTAHEILQSRRRIRGLSASEFAELFCVLASALKKATMTFQFSQYLPPRPGLTGFFSNLSEEDFLEYRHIREKTVEEARDELLRQHPGAYEREPVQADNRMFPDVTPSFTVRVRPADGDA